MTASLPRVSVRAVIYEKDAILLTKYHDKFGYWYVTPGGAVKHGETLLEALHRELEEELGVTVMPGDVLCIREIIAARHRGTHLPLGFHQVEVFFSAELGSSVGDASKPDMDQVGYEWICLDKLDKLTLFPKGMVAHFQTRAFPKVYIGEVR